MQGKINVLNISDYTKYLIGWSDLVFSQVGAFFIDKGKISDVLIF
jgi:hypothetical protein